MPDRPEIPDALREAVERTVQATVETRGKAQGAVDDLTGSVDDLVKGAEKGLTARRRSVRAAVEERLPATQEDIKELRPSCAASAGGSRRSRSGWTRPWRRRRSRGSEARGEEAQFRQELLTWPAVAS